MKVTIPVMRTAVAAFMVGCCLLPAAWAAGANSNMPLPAIINEGFESWTKGTGPDTVVRVWEKGGLMEGSNKAAAQARFFRSLSPALGNYRSHEWLEAKTIGRSSQVIYLAINFEHGAVYSRFLVYRTERDWVVQSMDFSERPEDIMPWLALAGGRAE